MPWYFPWSDSIKKRACRYLLQHYLGHFLKEKLSLDQLSVDIYNGKGTIHDVLLDVGALNETLNNLQVPFEIIDGFVGSISVCIPWSTLINDNTDVEVQGLELTIQPKQRAEANMTPGAMFESMMSSMTTSMDSLHVAEDILKQEVPSPQQQTTDSYEGLQEFAGTIDTVLTKIKVVLTDTVVRLEHLPKEAQLGVALEVRIKRINYFDENADESLRNPTSEVKTQYEPVAVANKIFHIYEMMLYSDEFSKQSREMKSSFYEKKTSSVSYSPDLDDFSPLQGPEMGQPVVDSDPVLITKFSGQQKLKFKIKQNDALAGPKLSFACDLVSFNAFLSPRQVHLLLELAKGVITPATSETLHSPKKYFNKPMKVTDYDRCEEDLQMQLLQDRMRPAAERQSWQEYDVDEVSDNSLYFSMGTSNQGMEMNTSYTSSCSTKSSASTYSYKYGAGYSNSSHRDKPFQATIPKRKYSRGKDSQRHQDEGSTDQIEGNLKVGFFSITILHEDPTTTPSNGIDEAVSSTEKLKKMSAQFFDSLPNLTTSGLTSAEDLVCLRQEIATFCQQESHLGLLGKPLVVEFKQRSSGAQDSYTVGVTMGILEVVECLFDKRNTTSSLMGFSLPIANKRPTYTELLTFTSQVPDTKTSMYASLYSNTGSTAPCLKIELSSFEKIRHGSRSNSHQAMETKVNVTLQECQSEIDVSLVDRINALLYSRPFTNRGHSYQGQHTHLDPDSNLLSDQGLFNQVIDEVNDQKTSLSISSEKATLNIRFPVPDLRSGKDRRPWWVKDLRQEILILEVNDLDFKTELGSSELTSSYEIICRQIHGLFQLNPNEDPISFAMVSEGLPGNGFSDKEKGFDWPRLMVKTYAQQHSVLEDVEEDNFDSVQADSLNGACQFAKSEASPFSNKKVMYDNEEMVMAGDRMEMTTFQNYAESNTKMVLEFTLPCVNIAFPDDNFVELIYNRLNNDLLLWESLVPSPLVTQDQFSLFRMPPADLNSAGQLLSNLSVGMDRFFMCKSGINMEESSSESEDDIVYSIHDRRHKKARPQSQVRQQSKVCVSVKIANGKVGARNSLKAKDGSLQSVEHGEVLLEVTDGNIFTVVCHDGDPDLSYLCILARRTTLYHAPCLPTTPCPGIVERLTLAPPKSLDVVIEPTVDNGDVTDMLSVAIKIKCETYTANKKEPCRLTKAATSRRKDFVIAVGVHGGTLRHRMVPSGRSWLSQTMDILDLKDYEILGYVLPTVVTELHIHLSHCRIDYRPLHLPIHSMVSFDGFSISSNIIAESSASLLRFIVDNAALFLSDKIHKKTANLEEDYVCVLQMGSFELSLRSNDSKDLRSPKTDLKATTNGVNVRTCSDSFKALQEIIVYFANDGDLDKVETPSPSQDPTPVASVTSLDDTDSPLTQSQSDHVNTMMAEAMSESKLQNSTDSDTGIEQGAKVFFFPDETEAMQTKSLSDAEDSTDTGDHPNSSDSSLGSDFCFVDDPGLGIIPKDGEPKIRFLDSESLRLIENHFKLPQGPTDLLQAPEHFPIPISRYVLKEMNLAWYMYAGSDFSPAKDKKCSDSRHADSPSARHHKGTLKDQWTAKSWLEKGGPAREMDNCMELHLSKVRLLQESYPETTEQASRQVLIVNDVEIWDRMALSQINKFLYEYTSEKMPKQTHANMVVVKALHVRPDRRRPQQQECSLKVSILPLRFNVDQDALFFLKKFFVTSTASHSGDTSQASGRPTPNSSSNNLETQPVMKVGSPIEEEQEIMALELIKFDELSDSNTEDSDTFEGSVEEEAQASPVFVKSFVFSPDVPIKLDYKGKHVDMEQGTLTGLIVGLAQLNSSELKLKRFHHRHGLLGMDKVVTFALNEWLQDIKRSQLPTILGGVGPMHSLVQLVQGIKDLVWLPVEQYRKDGRIIRGLQRGANSFTTSTAMAALELTNRLVQTVQVAAEFTYDMVSPGPSIKSKARRRRHKRSIQPADFREGVTNAYYVVKEGLADTAENIIRAATEEGDYKGMSGAVGGVVRQIPPTLLQPVILASEATSNVLGGMRNQLQPEARKEDERKWKLEELK